MHSNPDYNFPEEAEELRAVDAHPSDRLTLIVQNDIGRPGTSRGFQDLTPYLRLRSLREGGSPPQPDVLDRGLDQVDVDITSRMGGWMDG